MEIPSGDSAPLGAQTQESETKARLEELQFRARLCRGFINELKQMDDPRAPAAIEKYEAQAATLDAMIAELHPEPVVVGLKTATLSGTVPGVGG